MAAEELLVARPPGGEREDEEDEELDETLVERLWGLTEIFSRAALWVGTTSFMILVLPVVFETERLQLEQQQLQQQRQILLGPNTGMSGGMPTMMPPVPGKM
ncbi:hypothetical protein CRUP_035619 [Coryphaenoides rupestris]|nr:hypothetical protein CRUP_035619 [Coryphaenoides rupestris]